MNHSPEIQQDQDYCLNCGNPLSGPYCSECGQKVQPTNVPLWFFLKDAAESLFNIDNRIFKTLKDLFLKPGEVTRKYLEGKRARYLPPLRIYVSVSLLYFLVISLVDTNQFLIATLDLDGGEGRFVDFLQYSMILLVPAFAWVVKLLHLRQKRYYVQFLIFSIHLHVVWFFFFGIISICDHTLNTIALSGTESLLVSLLSSVSKITLLVYLVLYVKNVFEQGWVKAIVKSLLVVVGYIFIMLGVVLFYIFVWS